MAFENETVPPELHNFLKEISLSRGARKPEVWKWTVDKSKELFVYHTHHLGGAYEGTPLEMFFIIGHKNKVVASFVAESENSAASPVGRVLRWNVKNIIIEESSFANQFDPQKIISEALDARGDLFKRDRVDAVEVKYA